MIKKNNFKIDIEEDDYFYSLMFAKIRNLKKFKFYESSREKKSCGPLQVFKSS